jgi:hypothetical protein
LRRLDGSKTLVVAIAEGRLTPLIVRTWSRILTPADAIRLDRLRHDLDRLPLPAREAGGGTFLITKSRPRLSPADGSVVTFDHTSAIRPVSAKPGHCRKPRSFGGFYLSSMARRISRARASLGSSSAAFASHWRASGSPKLICVKCPFPADL